MLATDYDKLATVELYDSTIRSRKNTLTANRQCLARNNAIVALNSLSKIDPYLAFKLAEMYISRAAANRQRLLLVINDYYRAIQAIVPYQDDSYSHAFLVVQNSIAIAKIMQFNALPEHQNPPVMHFIRYASIALAKMTACSDNIFQHQAYVRQALGFATSRRNTTQQTISYFQQAIAAASEMTCKAGNRILCDLYNCIASAYEYAPIIENNFTNDYKTKFVPIYRSLASLFASKNCITANLATLTSMIATKLPKKIMADILGALLQIHWYSDIKILPSKHIATLIKSQYAEYSHITKVFFTQYYVYPKF